MIQFYYEYKKISTKYNQKLNRSHSIELGQSSFTCKNSGKHPNIYSDTSEKNYILTT